MRTSHALQADIDELQKNKNTLGDHLKPWATEALKLSQDVDVAIKQLNQTLESVTATTEGSISETLVDIAGKFSTQSEGMLPPLAKAIKLFQAQVDNPPS